MEYCVKNPDKYTQLLADYSGKQIRYTVMDNAQNFDIMSVVDPKTSTTTPPQVTKQQKKWYQF
jgi:autonomous glycyl radical cofactor GrcA